MRWNKIRRRITRELDVQIADWREEKLNDLLGSAWEQYKAALSTGAVLELEARYSQFVGDVIGDVIDVTVEGPEREAA